MLSVLEGHGVTVLRKAAVSPGGRVQLTYITHVHDRAFRRGVSDLCDLSQKSVLWYTCCA